MENWEKRFVQILHRHFEQMRIKNHRYSMRAYAKKLGVSIGTLSEVLRFKLRLSTDRAIKIVSKLELPLKEYNRLLSLMGRSAEIEKRQLLEGDQEILANWIHRAILYSFDLDGERPSISALADRLRLTPAEVAVKIDELLAKNFLQKDASGQVYRPQQYWKTADGDGGEFVRRSHLSNLALTEKAFKEVPVAERDFTSLMFAGNHRQLEFVRAEIRSFYDRLLLIMEEPPRDQLYQMSISLYPIQFDQKSEKET